MLVPTLLVLEMESMKVDDWVDLTERMSGQLSVSP